MTARAGTALALTAVALTAAGSVARAHDPVTTRVTWNAEVSRIFAARCVSCHRTGGKAPMALTTYAEVRPWARAIREEVLTRRMPKWQAMRGFGSFRNDPSLSPSEIALIVAWIAGGAPEGRAEASTQSVTDAAEAPQLPPAPSHTVKLACGAPQLPAGTLLAVRPEVPAGRRLGIAVRFRDGRTEPLLWIREYDPEFPVTYWLRRPLRVGEGARLITSQPALPDCAVELTVAPPG